MLLEMKSIPLGNHLKLSLLQPAFLPGQKISEPQFGSKVKDNGQFLSKSPPSSQFRS